MLQHRDAAAGWQGAVSTSTQYSVPNSLAPVSVTVNLYGVPSSRWLHLPNGKPFKAFKQGRVLCSAGCGGSGIPFSGEEVVDADGTGDGREDVGCL